MTNARMAALSPAMLQMLGDLAQDVLLDLWELDCRVLGGELHRFCNYTNELGKNVVWKGQVYQAYPIKADGFELNATGAGNRPTLTVSNLLGLVTGLVEEHRQLIGAKVVRRQTYARFLDAANFQAAHATADSTQEVVSQYIIERMTALTAESATFELAAPSESDGAIIPARIMLANVCAWQYRGDGCGYTGKPVADSMDMPTDDPTKDRCSGTLLGCKARFGATAALPYGGFVSCDKVGR
ncbi:phage minor tail protein L [Wielerella bovis]|uniref:phage minor tail protein L n=1 Tax=Wielerella bovis TaxID=2917790 RepID=UPI003D2B54C7